MILRTIFLLFLLPYSLQAVELHSVPLHSYPDSVCNNGQPSNYFWKNENSKKWFIGLEGGWSCSQREDCLEKLKNNQQVSPLRNGKIQKDKIYDQLKNYNLVFLPYCSSDFFAGNHQQDLGERIIYFRGRVIVTSMFQDLLKKGLGDAEEVVVAGWTAGSVGVTMNLDLWESLKAKKKYLFDGVWFVNSERQFFETNRLFSANSLQFVFKNPPPHCQADLQNCYPTFRLVRDKVLDAMIVLNLGDEIHQMIGVEKIKKELLEDMRLAGAGLSFRINEHLPAKNRSISDNENYFLKRQGRGFAELFENWLQNKGNSLFVE